MNNYISSIQINYQIFVRSQQGTHCLYFGLMSLHLTPSFYVWASEVSPGGPAHFTERSNWFILKEKCDFPGSKGAEGVLIYNPSYCSFPESTKKIFFFLFFFVLFILSADS